MHHDLNISGAPCFWLTATSANMNASWPNARERFEQSVCTCVSAREYSITHDDHCSSMHRVKVTPMKNSVSLSRRIESTIPKQTKSTSNTKYTWKWWRDFKRLQHTAFTVHHSLKRCTKYINTHTHSYWELCVRPTTSQIHYDDDDDAVTSIGSFLSFQPIFSHS